MRHLLTILTLLVTTFTFCQSLSDKYLHYKTDSYWDTTLYKSEQVYYYEIGNGKITQKEYPVLAYLYTKIISETPRMTEDTFERRGWSQDPYKYIRKNKSIYLQYFDLGKRKLQLNKEYSLNHSDTVNWLANKNTLHSKDGISVGGYSTYLGEATIEINGKQFSTFHFLEDHDQYSSHPSHFVKDVFLEQVTLIPIKFITTHYDYKTKQKQQYSSVTILSSTSNSLPDYSNKKTEDMVLYQKNDTIWTEPQRQAFLKMFPSNMKQYAECLLKKLERKISFYHFEKNTYFRDLVTTRECQ